MKNLLKESYLKDKGSSYRYTQAYKLQLTVLQQLAPLIINLDIADNQIELTMNMVYLYLSNKQPLPLQVRNIYKKIFSIELLCILELFFSSRKLLYLFLKLWQFMIQI